MIPLIQDFKTVVLADGNFPTHPTPLRCLLSAERIVCCDGAAEKLLHFGLEPNFIVGDLDSISAETKKRYAKILHKISEQETNDLTKAVNFCIENNWKEITILGLSGQREDHTLGNLSLLGDYAEKVGLQAFSDYGVFNVQSVSETYESFIGQQVSLFSFIPTTLLSTQNLVYPLEKKALTSWWQGTLNESAADHFLVEMENLGKILVFRVFA